MTGHLFTHQSGAYHMTVSPDGRGNLAVAVYIGHSGHAIILPTDAVERLIDALITARSAPPAVKQLVTCDCDAGDACPQGKAGSAYRCTILKKVDQ